MKNAIQITPQDTVAVALCPIEKGEQVCGVTAAENIAQGHKMALCAIKTGEPVIKYGCPIGHATAEIAAGEWVHTHNCKTNLSEEQGYQYTPETFSLPAARSDTFMGYRRANGKVGVRNEIWIIPTVGCVNGVAERLAKLGGALAGGSLEGVYAFPHPYGCSQLGDDHVATQQLLAGLVHHPNAAGVLVVGLGCENNTMESFRAVLGEVDENRVKFMVCQNETDEFATGEALLQQLACYAKEFKREPISVSELIVGMKCGGSDGLSGITANPTVGVFSDMLIASGGTTVLTEVPEMFGGESVLLPRCTDAAVFDKSVEMVNDFKDYFVRHGQVVYENPSPGNKNGGITTLEDKSLGCVQKGGKAPVVDVLRYAERVEKKGLNLLSGPGNDLVSCTALAASGAHIILLTTGRGTPFGSPVPTVKISTNSALAAKKSGWIDFDAGEIVSGVSIAQMGERLYDFVLQTANGAQTKAEQNGFRDMAIFKNGITL